MRAKLHKPRLADGKPFLSDGKSPAFLGFPHIRPQKGRFVLTLMGNTLTWSPRDPLAADWVTNIYDLSGHLLDNSGSIDVAHQSANILDMWDPPPFQISLQAQDGDGVNFGPESNKITWAG